MKKKILSIAIILCAVLCFTACQPTPEVEPVVNKREDVRAETIKETPAPTQTGEAAQPEKEAEHFEPVAYKILQRWTEEIKKGEKFIVRADIDVQVPKVEKFPVVKLRKGTFTQQQVDDMIAKLLPGEHTYYQYPMPNTKEYYEERIVELKQSLARSEAGEDGETPEAIRGYIKEAEADYAAAPEENELIPIEPKFDYRRDYDTGEPDLDSGKHDISVSTTIDGVDYIVSAGDDPEGYRGFSFTCVYYTTENDVNMQLAYMKEMDAVASVNDFGEAELLEIQKETERYSEKNEKMQSSGIDLDAMRQKGIDLMEELGIEDLQVTACENILYSEIQDVVNDPYGSSSAENDKPGCIIKFARQSGGVACVEPISSGSSNFLDKGTYYAPPFNLESGDIIFDKEGNLLGFMWNDIATEYEQVAADVELLDFAEIKDRAIDQLYYQNPFYEGSEISRMEFELTEVKLFMGYVNAKDELQSALVVPIWRFSVVGKDIYENGPNNKRVEWPAIGDNNVYINALDGGTVLMYLPESGATDLNIPAAEE